MFAKNTKAPFILKKKKKIEDEGDENGGQQNRGLQTIKAVIVSYLDSSARKDEHKRIWKIECLQNVSQKRILSVPSQNN